MPELSDKQKMDNSNKRIGPFTVLMVNLAGDIAGAEKSLLLLIQNLPKDVQPVIARPQRGTLADKLSKLELPTAEIYPPPCRFNYSFIWLCYFLLVNVQLVGIVHKVRPAIIHANSTKAALCCILAKILTGRKLIWHVRDIPRHVFVSRVCGLFSNQVICVSFAIQKILFGQGVKKEIICVVHNAVSGITLKPKPVKTQGDLTFANVGQFVKGKKQHLFVEAADRFIQQGGNANFILVGDDIFGRDGDYKKSLYKQIEDCSSKDRIQIAGWQEDMEKLWDKVDCLVHTADKEPFGRVIIEAMAHGTVVIAADAFGPAEIVEHEKTGLLFRPDNAIDLTIAMQRIAEDSELADRLASNARRQICLDFQAEDMVEKVIGIYEKILAA